MNEPLPTNNALTTTSPKVILSVLLLIVLWVIQASYSIVLAASADPTESLKISRGKVVANKFCALCHGKNLEGQPNWRKRNDNGKLPAPPLNGTGHTWHHADELLFGMIKEGIVPPYGPPNYKTDMPAWGTTLSDEDIWAVLAYIKSRWPAEAQKIQSEINQESFKKL